MADDEEETKAELVATGESQKPIGDDDYPLVSVKGVKRGRCKALNRAKRRCGNRAHDDTNYCRKHGAAQLALLRHRGRYAEYFGTNRRLEAKFLAHLQDPDICDLSPELALQRAILDHYLDIAAKSAEQGGPGLASPEAAAAVTELNKSIAHLAQQVHTITTRRTYAISVDQLDWMVEQIVGIISDLIPDHNTVAAIAERLESLALPTYRGRAAPPFNSSEHSG